MKRTFRPTLESLESRLTPATLDVSGGVLTFTGDASGNNVTQYTSGSTLVIHDQAAAVTLTAGAAAAGWKGGGTGTVTGPRSSVSASEAFALTSGTLNLRACDVPVAVDCTGGACAVNLGSTAPSLGGNLAALLADVTVTGDGDDSLTVSDQGAASGNAAVSIDPTGIYGFAGPIDSVAILTSGSFASLRVVGSSSGTLSEGYTLAGSAGPLRLDCNAGSDSVTVTADTTGVIYLGLGDDTLTVDAGVTFAGDVHTGPGADAVNANAPGYGTVTGSIGP